MADHIDGPRATADPSTDLTDLFAFTSPADASRTVLAAGVFPSAGESALFSNVADHSIVLRRVSVTGRGDDAGFKAGDEEIRFTFAFGPLEPQTNGDKPVQRGTCTLPDGQVLRFVTNDENGATTPDGVFRVFAGLRSDPFFDGWATPSPASLKPAGVNLLQDDNVLCILVEFKTRLVLEPDRGSLFGVIAETAPNAPPGPLKPANPPRFDWAGRPEQTQFRLNNMRTADEPDLRDLWNQQTPFSDPETLPPVFRDRLTQSLSRWDLLDGKADWSPAALAANVRVFLDDYLLVDVRRPITDDSHLEIEKSTINGDAYQTGGGRTLDANVIDILVTWLVNRDQGPFQQGSAQGPTRLSTRKFPYAAPPNTDLVPDEKTIELASPVDQVWSLVGCFERNWNPSFVDIEVTGTGIGQLRTLTMANGQRLIERLESVDDGQRTLRYSLVSGIQAAHFSGVLQVTAKESGSLVYWKVEYRPDGQGELVVKQIVDRLLTAGVAGLKNTFGSPP